MSGAADFSRQRCIDDARGRAHAIAAEIIDGTRMVIGSVAAYGDTDRILGDIIERAPAWYDGPAFRATIVDAYNTHLAIALVGIPRERAALAAARAEVPS